MGTSIDNPLITLIFMLYLQKIGKLIINRTHLKLL